MNDNSDGVQRLHDLRRAIDQLTMRLLDLLNARAALVLEVGALKRSIGLPIRDRGRETELFEMLVDGAAGPLDEAAIVRLFRQIIDESVRLVAPPEAPSSTAQEERRAIERAL